MDDLAHRTTADERLGLLAHPAPWLALGATADHLFERSVAGAPLDRTWTLAAGFRPLALDPARAHGWGTRLTLTADVALAEGAPRGDARVRVGGEFEALPGVLVRGALEDHGGAYLGLTLRGVNHTAAAQRGCGGPAPGLLRRDDLAPRGGGAHGAGRPRARSAWRWCRRPATSATTPCRASRSPAART